MRRLIILATIQILLFSSLISADEINITGFPAGAGGSVDKRIFAGYNDQFQAIADTLKAYPSSLAIITGESDGATYEKNNDALNPALAVGRAHILRNYLIDNYDINPDQIIIQSKETILKSDAHRGVSIRIDARFTEINTRLESLANRPPVEKHYTEIVEKPFDNMGLMFGAGFASSPFGGLPILTGAVTFKKSIMLECFAGHTIWNDNFTIAGVDLKTRLRSVGGQVIVFPVEDIPVGLLGGWIRFEEMAREYSKYVRMSEGVTFGVRAMPVKYLSMTLSYNPSKHFSIDDIKARTKNGQFLFYALVQLGFGGAK